MTYLKKYLRLPLCLCTLFGLGSLSAQIDFTGSYEENFNTLPGNNNSSGTTSFSFSNDSTLNAWYTSVNIYGGNARASSGKQSASGSGIYSWGNLGGPDQALGLFHADGFSPETAYVGVQMLNNTGEAVTSLQITYTIEQWRRSTNATTWTGSYLTTSDSGNQIDASGYTGIAEATVTAQEVGSPSGLNGDLAEYQQRVTITLTDLNWQAGEYLWIRWGNAQVANSSGLGIDDLTISAIPEAGTSSLLFFALLVMSVVYGRRRLNGIKHS